MSVYNSGLYANSRMLYSLAKQGNAPAYLGRLNKRGVPVGGVVTSAIIIAIAWWWCSCGLISRSII